MGFLDDLVRGAQDTAARVYNQANPFDGGKNYNTPVRQAPRPQSQPARAPLQVAQARPQQLQMAPQGQPQAKKKVEMIRPSFKNFEQDFKKFDTFNYADKIRLINEATKNKVIDKNQAFKAIDYAVNYHAAKPRDLNPIETIVDSGWTTGERIKNTTAAGLQGTKLLADLADDALKGNKNLEKNWKASDAKMRQFLDAKDHNGNAGSFLTAQQAQNNDGDMIKNFVRPVLGTAGEVTPWVAPYTKIAQFGKVVAPGIVGPGANIATTKAAQYGMEGLVNAGMFGVTSPARQYGQTGQVDPMVVLQEMAMGGAGAALTHGAVDGAGAGIKAGVQQGQQAVDLYKSMTPAQRQAGFIAGPNAKGFKDAQAKGQVFDGPDGKARFEGDDSMSKIKNPNGNTIGEVLDHPTLYKNYPELKDMKLVRMSEQESKARMAGGSYNPDTNTMTIAPSLKGDKLRRTLIHEINHKLDQVEGRNGGTSPEYVVQEANKAIKAIEADRKAVESSAVMRAFSKDIEATKGDLNAQMALVERYKQNPEYVQATTALRNANEQLRAQQSKADNPMAQYERNLSEAEARAVEARMNMGMGERYVKGENLYHGSPNKIEGDLRPSRHGEFGQGVYFSKDKKLAEQYMTSSGEPTGTSSLVEIQSAANLKKMTREQFLKDREGFYAREEKLNGGEWDGNVARRAEDKQRLKYAEEGYDGLDVFEDKQIVVFPERLDSLKQKMRSTFYDSLDVPKEDLIVRNGGGKAMSEGGKIIYRGGKPFDEKLVKSDGTSFATDKSIAERWRGSYRDGVLEEFQLKSDAKVMVAPKPDVPLGQLTDSDKFGLVAKASREGYDAVDMTSWGESEIRVINAKALQKPSSNVAMSIDDSRIYKPTKAIKQAEDDFASGKITANQLENIRQKEANTAKASTKKALPRVESQEPSIKGFQKSSKSDTTQVKLNTNRLDVTDEAKVRLDKETNEVIAKMSNEDVKAYAKAAGADMKSYSPERTRKKIAEQLNLRNEITTLERQIADAKSAGDTARVTDLMAKSAELGRTSRSQGTDIARQLQARRIIADTLATPQQKLFRLFDEAGVDPAVYTKRMADVDMNNADEVVKAYRDLVPAKFGDWLDKFRYTNMLSSPLTHMVNITSNLGGLSGIAPVEKLYAGAVDAGRAALTGGPRTRFAGEAGAYMKGAAKAVPEALQKFTDVMTGKKAIDMPDAEALKYGKLADGGVLGTADTVLSFIPKLLEASDQLGMTLARGGERRALNYRGARNVELPRDLEGAVDDAALYRVFRQELNKQGQGYLLGTIDAIPSAILTLRRSKNPIVSTTAKFTIPFVTTPVNLFKQGIEYSPAGVLTLAGHADKTGQAAKALMGTTVVTLAAAALAAEDRITFAEPSEKTQRDAFRAEGKQPYAIKIGDKWFGYSKTHPAIAFNLASVAAAKEAFDKSAIDQSGMDKALGMFGGVMGYYRDQSFMKGVGDFTSNLEMKDGGDAEAAILSLAGNWSKQLVPFNSMVSWIGRQVDPTQRSVDRQAEPLEQFRQNLVRDMPYLNKDVPARLNPYYKDQDIPIMNDNPTLNAFSPIRVTNDRGYGNTTGLNMTERREQYELPDADRPAFRQAAIDKKYATKLAKADKEKSGTTSTGSDIKVDATLAKADKDVITKYDSLDEAKRKEWFNKENDAEYKVAKAKFENDKKAGKLDQVSEYRRTTELKKQEIGSKYSKETRDLYKLGKAQLFNYVTNSPKGEKLAQELLEYDRKLVEAGLNPYDNALKFKNGLAPAKGGRKGGGVRTAKAKKGRATGKGSRGGKQAAPKMDSTNAGAIRLAALGQKKSTGSASSFKKQLKVAGGIKKPSITAFKKAAKTNVNVRRTA